MSMHSSKCKTILYMFCRKLSFWYLFFAFNPWRQRARRMVCALGCNSTVSEKFFLISTAMLRRLDATRRSNIFPSCASSIRGRPARGDGTSVMLFLILLTTLWPTLTLAHMLRTEKPLSSRDLMSCSVSAETSSYYHHKLIVNVYSIIRLIWGTLLSLSSRNKSSFELVIILVS